MKNILLLTPIYPAKDLPKNNTPVVHYFTKEWSKMGYKVVVIHYKVNFPKLIHLCARPIQKFLASKLSSIIDIKQTPAAEYEIEGVTVKRIPLCKYAPHTKYPAKEIEKAISQSKEFCNKIGFTPDVIISHWINPQLIIMKELKEIYQVPTCYIAHDIGRDLKTIFKKEATDLLNSIDVIGYRSDYIKSEFESYFQTQSKKSFLCYSGIPESYIETLSSNKRSYNLPNRIIYVGALIKRKYPSTIIPATMEAFDRINFSITYIGDGNEQKNMRKMITKHQIENQVKLLGHIPREQVIKELQHNDIFVMISKNETFGLVYLEAMAAGCLTIASKEEGFDGIIKDGYNGFLCKAGDEKELAEILKKIKNMSENQRKEISLNAIKTAARLTDTNVAKTYIQSIETVAQTYLTT